MPFVGIGEFQLVDVDDTTTLWDCNDDAGTASPQGVRTNVRELQLMGPGRAVTRFSPSTMPGASTPYSKDELVSTTWKQRVYGQPGDALQQWFGVLQRLLTTQCRIRYSLANSSVTRWIEYEPTDQLPALIGGDPADVFHLTQINDFPSGVPIVLWRQPQVREQELDPALNVLVNPTLLINLAGDGVPDGWAWTSTSGITAASIDAAQEALRFTAATTANRDLQQTYAASPADVWTGSFYGSSLDASTARFKVVLEFLSNTGSVLATATSSAIAPGATFQRVSVTSAAAPAGTLSVRMSLRVANATSSSTRCWFKNAQLESEAGASDFRVGPIVVSNDLTGPTGGRAFPIWVNGDAPAPGILELTTDTGAKLAAVTVGRVSSGGIVGSRSLTGLLKPGVQCESGTPGVDTSVISDSGAASGGQAQQTTYASNPTVMARRVRIPVTGVLLDALQGGAWNVYCRLKPTAASAHTPQLRWSAADVDPAVNTELERPFDVSGASSFGYFDWPLGVIALPDPSTPVSQLTLELWSRRDSGSGNLRWDCITFAPADDLSVLTKLYVPGSSTESWVPSSYVVPTSPTGLSAGTLEGNYVLAGVNQGCGVPPVTGLAWPVGRHRVIFPLYFRGGSGPSTVHTAVRNVTDGNDVVSKNVTRNVNGLHPITLEFDSVSGKSYEPQVYMSSYARPVAIQTITHSFVSYLPAGYTIHTDSGLGLVQALDDSGNFVQDLTPAGAVPLVAPPGLSIVTVFSEDVTINGFPQGESVLGRALTARYRHAARFYG